MRLGKFDFDCPIILAPMAGISDRAFRIISREHGADYAVSEMIHTDPRFRDSTELSRRMDFADEPGPTVVQIAGPDPRWLAEAARVVEARGADVIDINMGCPAKKVCRQAAGSALLNDENLVGRICDAVVGAVDVPVTLKIRTGWDRKHRNALSIAAIAQSAGIAALTIHGRTRACGYRGVAEYDTIAMVKAAVTIPVIANGDIDGPGVAQRILEYTKADGLMIGRGAQGNPWLFGQIKSALGLGPPSCGPSPAAVLATMKTHLQMLHSHYGTRLGTRIARKHIGWYAAHLTNHEEFRRRFNRLESYNAQFAQINNYQHKNYGALAA
jgi:tRNA-dihydrouridine synthase B